MNGIAMYTRTTLLQERFAAVATRHGYAHKSDHSTLAPPQGRNGRLPYLRVQQESMDSSISLTEPAVRCWVGLMIGPSDDLAARTSTQGGFPHREIRILSRRRLLEGQRTERMQQRGTGRPLFRPRCLKHGNGWGKLFSFH